METTWQDGSVDSPPVSLSEACTPACLQASIGRETQEGSSSWSPETDKVSACWPVGSTRSPLGVFSVAVRNTVIQGQTLLVH